ncbi:MAG: type II toxin-antitoxin system RelE/ParE family toxin [Burkholderiaceae bacterium]|jgi:toxin ParE1/3/4
MAEYRLTPAAEQDLESIWIYTAKEWGLDQASRYFDSLIAAFEKLAIFPQAAPACDFIKPGYRRCPVERHTIYFRVTDYGIAVIRVLHQSMDASTGLIGQSE